jgi:hypothetical protein
MSGGDAIAIGWLAGDTVSISVEIDSGQPSGPSGTTGFAPDADGGIATCIGSGVGMRGIGAGIGIDIGCTAGIGGGVG